MSNKNPGSNGSGCGNVRIFRCFDIRPNDMDKSFAACFNRVEALFYKLAGTDSGIFFKLVDRLSGQAASNLKKDISVLKDYETIVKEYLECYDQDCPVERCFDEECIRETSVFSNMEHLFANGGAASEFQDALKKVAEGLPQRFPFRRVMIVFSGIDWFESRAHVNPLRLSQWWHLPDRTDLYWLHEFYVSSIILWAYQVKDRNWQWGTRIVIETEVPPPDSEHMPDLPAKVYSYIEELGEVTYQRLWVVPEEEERKRLEERELQAQQVLVEIDSYLGYHIKDIMFLYQLTPICGEKKYPDGTFFTGSTRSLLSTVFTPRGYRYIRSFTEGCFEGVVKRTINNNYIELDFSGACGVEAFRFAFKLKGLFWEKGLLVTIPADKLYGCSGWIIQDALDRERYFQYAARITEYLEARLVPRLEKIYGASPAWYDYCYE